MSAPQTVRSATRRLVGLTALRWLPVGLTTPITVLLAQSLLEAHAPPGAARPGRWEGAGWRVEVGRGEEGPRDVALRPVRVAVGGVLLETLRPGPVEALP